MSKFSAFLEYSCFGLHNLLYASTNAFEALRRQACYCGYNEHYWKLKKNILEKGSIILIGISKKFHVILEFWNNYSVAFTSRSRSRHRRCPVKKIFLKIPQNSQENTCAIVSFLIKLPQACNLVKKETLTQVFSCEFCEIFKNTFFTEQLRTIAFPGCLLEIQGDSMSPQYICI